MYRSLRPAVAVSLALLALLLALPASAQANVQVIHNAPDALTQEVDVYIDGERALDDFAFRTATPFLALPSDTDLLVQIAPANSADAGDAVFSQVYNLPDGDYQLIASGLLTFPFYAPNPDGLSTGLMLLTGDYARQTSGSDADVAVRVVHGATDAPTVDIRSGSDVLVDDARYLSVTPYLSLPADAYTLDVTTADGAPVASYGADLSEAGGAAVTVLASGFLAPLDNQNGPSFGLLAVFADGSTALLPAAEAPARVQVIHNAPDPAAAEVDVYIDGVLTLDDFAFRTATPYLDLPSGQELSVAVAPGTSSGVEDALFSTAFFLEPGSATRLVAQGVLDPEAFAANPDGEETAFQLAPVEGSERVEDHAGVGLSVGHGSPDAPAVDILAFVDPLVENLSYGEVTGYFAAAAIEYRVKVLASGGPLLAEYVADLRGRSGETVTVLASGFVSSADNQGGPGFELLAVFADGTTALLPTVPSGTARLQIIHNAPDPAAASVDIYIEGELALDDFAFRSATHFVELPAGVAFSVAIAPGTSASVADAVFTESFTLVEGTATQVIASGVLDPAAFAENPDGVPTGFQLLAAAGAVLDVDVNEVALRVVHGAPDAPTVDIRSGGQILFDDAAYTDVTSYLGLQPQTYTIGVTAADGAPVAAFEAPLGGVGGAGVTVLASGFLSPGDDQNGPAFALLAVFPDGSTLELPIATDAESAPGPERLTLGFPTPHPITSTSRVAFTLDRPGPAAVRLYDTLGRQVATLAEGEYGTDQVVIDVDAARLAAGAYVIRLDAASGVRTRIMTVVR